MAISLASSTHLIDRCASVARARSHSSATLRRVRDAVEPGGAAQMGRRRAQHVRGRAQCAGWAEPPDALVPTLLGARCEWPWPWRFAATRAHLEPGAGQPPRHQMHETVAQQAVHRAVLPSALPTRATCCKSRESFTAHLLESGVGVRTVRECPASWISRRRRFTPMSFIAVPRACSLPPTVRPAADAVHVLHSGHLVPARGPGRVLPHGARRSRRLTPARIMPHAVRRAARLRLSTPVALRLPAGLARTRLDRPTGRVCGYCARLPNSIWTDKG